MWVDSLIAVVTGGSCFIVCSHDGGKKICLGTLLRSYLAPDIIITSRSFFHLSRSNIIIAVTMALRHNEDISRFAVMVLLWLINFPFPETLVLGMYFCEDTGT